MPCALEKQLGLVILAFSLGYGIFSSTGAAAAGPENRVAAHYYVPEVPADMGPVEFYLITGGVGHEVNDRFGHTAIRVRSPEEGTDVVFNWGKFSFDDPTFLWKFFRGQLDYSMGVRTFQNDVAHYLKMGRRLVMEKINLTARQKRRLLEKIAWNAVPENRHFAYQYWYKNCATIPRDYLDEVLEGQLRAKFFNTQTASVYRDYVRKNLAYTPFAAPLLDVLMNSNIDRKITAWEEMFLPEKLHSSLLNMPSVDDEGNPVLGSLLLTDPEVLLDNKEEWEPLLAPLSDYGLLSLPPLFAWVVAVFLFAAARRDSHGLKAPLRRSRSLAERFVGAGIIYWSGISGFFGLTLLLDWFFSGHPDGWHNVNLLIFWPIDWLLLPTGWALFHSGEPGKDRWPFPHAGRFTFYGHAATLALLTGLALLHVVAQDVWRMIAWFGLPLVVAAALVPSMAFSRRLAPQPGAAPDVGQGAPGRKAKMRA